MLLPTTCSVLRTTYMLLPAHMQGGYPEVAPFLNQRPSNSRISVFSGPHEGGGYAWHEVAVTA